MLDHGNTFLPSPRLLQISSVLKEKHPPGLALRQAEERAGLSWLPALTGVGPGVSCFSLELLLYWELLASAVLRSLRA